MDLGDFQPIQPCDTGFAAISASGKLLQWLFFLNESMERLLKLLPINRWSLPKSDMLSRVESLQISPNLSKSIRAEISNCFETQR